MTNLSRRDSIAALAMQGLIVSAFGTFNEIVDEAVAYADQLMFKLDSNRTMTTISVLDWNRMVELVNDYTNLTPEQTQELEDIIIAVQVP